MKYLAGILAVMVVAMAVCWNYASNSSRYEHAQYLSAYYKDGVKDYSFRSDPGLLKFDSPAAGRLRYMLPPEVKNFPRDEQVPISKEQDLKLASMRQEYGMNNVTAQLYVYKDLHFYDSPWSEYLELSSFGLACEKDVFSSYEKSVCFSHTQSDNAEQPNSANQIKALQWMEQAYYETRSPEEKTKVFGEYMDLIAVPINAYETAAIENFDPGHVAYREQTVIRGSGFAEQVSRKVAERWPKDVCAQNSFYWLFDHYNTERDRLRTQCVEQKRAQDASFKPSG